MRRFTLLVPLLVCMAMSRVAAQGASISEQMVRNLGNVDLWGLPGLRFDLGTTAELRRLGFEFIVTHNVTPSHDRGVRSAWKITGLRTCIWQDKNGNLIWSRPNGQELVFLKKNAYKNPASGWSAQIAANDKTRVKFSSATSGQEWHYAKGWLDRISDPVAGTVVFSTDRETILNVTRQDKAGNEQQILKIEHDDSGNVTGLIFPAQRRNVLSWTENHCLAKIEGINCGLISFQYDDALLKSWHADNGDGNTYAWGIRNNPEKNISFVDPPIMLVEDKDFTYEYGTRVGINHIIVRSKTRGFVSETRMTIRGLVQILPDKTIKGYYRRTPDGRRVLEEATTGD